MKKIIIIGAGAMGSAFAVPCIDNNNDVTIIGTHLEDNLIDSINLHNQVHPTLKIQLPPEIKFERFEKLQSILKKEREIAGEVQKKLFPKNKKIEKYIFAQNTPAKDVSGDYYDYYQVNDNEIYFILGDVTGKGIKAGILMANAASVFRSLAKMDSSVAKTALYMNNQVKDSSYQAMFITVILGRINLEKKEMEFINMGHEPMMVLDEKFNFEYVKSTLPPMGLMPVKDESFFKTTTMDISNKTILIYTDGVTEGYVDEGKELEVAGLENEIKKLNDPCPYFRGLVADIGPKIDLVEFDQPKRKFGETKNNIFTLIDTAFLAIVKHSKWPLRFMTLLGSAISIISISLAILFFILKLLLWNTFDFGIAPVLIGIFAIGGFQILFLGLLGEYIGVILSHVRKLPLVVEKERVNFD